MKELNIIKAEVKYVHSYWHAFDSIAREGIYFGADRAYPYESTIEWLKIVVEENEPCLFLMDGEQVVGFIEIDFRCKFIGYLGMGIIKEYREKGYGTLLLKRFMEECKSFGYKRLEIEVRLDNKRAIALYEKLGFQRFNIVEKGLIVGSEKFDILQMIYNFKETKSK